jgi:hypothetical protein
MGDDDLAVRRRQLGDAGLDIPVSTTSISARNLAAFASYDLCRPGRS